MCLIIAARLKKPSLEILKKAECANDDGAGVAWLNSNKKAQFKKGLTADEVHKLIETIPLPFVVHFRLGSRGLNKDLSLTHPFIISPESPLRLEGEVDKLLFHNGTIYETDWKWALMGAGLSVAKDGFMSDSRALAMILSQHKNTDFLRKIKGNFIVLDATLPKQNFEIIGDTFSYEDGMYFSNMEWKYKKKQSTFRNTVEDEFDGISYCSVYDNDNPKQNPAQTTENQAETELQKAEDSKKLCALLAQNILCQSCRHLLTTQRIRFLFEHGHDEADTMKCLDCSRAGSDSYFHKNDFGHPEGPMQESELPLNNAT